LAGHCYPLETGRPKKALAYPFEALWRQLLKYLQKLFLILFIRRTGFRSGNRLNFDLSRGPLSRPTMNLNPFKKNLPRILLTEVRLRSFRRQRPNAALGTIK
jgi:hypothetical protein